MDSSAGPSVGQQVFNALKFLALNKVDGKARWFWVVGVSIAVTGVAMGFAFLGMKLLHLLPPERKGLPLGDPAFIPDAILFRFLAPLAGLVMACVLLWTPPQRSFFRMPGGLGQFGFGASLGVMLISICVGGELLSRHESIGFSPESGRAILTDAVIQLLVFLPQSVGEEIMFRGVPMQQLARAIRGWTVWLSRLVGNRFNGAKVGTFLGQAISVLLIGGFFGLAHAKNAGATAMSGWNIALVGWWLGLLVFKCRGSLWIAGGVHAGWNWAQGFLWGEPVSGYPTGHSLFLRSGFDDVLWTGGKFGPEASVVCTAIFAVLIVLTLAWRGLPEVEGDLLSSRIPEPEPTPVPVVAGPAVVATSESSGTLQ